MSTIVLFSTIMPSAFASFSLTGTADEHKKSSRYSLSNINKYARKGFNPNLLKSTLNPSGNTVYSFNTGKTVISGSVLHFSKGNTTYLMPYQIKLKASKFKTPTPNN